MKRRVLAIALIPTILICGVLTFLGLHRSYKVDLASGAMRSDFAFFGFDIPRYSSTRYAPLDFMPPRAPIWMDSGASRLVNGYCLHGKYGSIRSAYHSAHWAMKAQELSPEVRAILWSQIIDLALSDGAHGFHIDYDYTNGDSPAIAAYLRYGDEVTILWSPIDPAQSP